MMQQHGIAEAQQQAGQRFSAASQQPAGQQARARSHMLPTLRTIPLLLIAIIIVGV